MQKRTEDKTRQLSQVAAAAPAQASEMASYLNKRAKVRRSRNRRRRPRQRRQGGPHSFSAIKDETCRKICAREAGAAHGRVDRQMNQRKALNEKLSALVAKRDKFVAEAAAKAPPKASSFDRVVKDTLKAQIKR